MANPVELSVKSQLDKVIKDLEKIAIKAAEVNQELEDAGDGIEDGLKDNTQRVERFLDRLRSMGGRVADQLRRDFRTLFSMEAIRQSLNFSEQFGDSIKQAVTLSDTIRKFGPAFGIARENFNRFHSDMMKGLGDLGLASDVGARTMEGLAGTPVRGQESLRTYAESAGQLASIANQQGQEGEIAKGIANVLVARGEDPNDRAAIEGVVEDLRRVFVTTGMQPTEILSGMESLFGKMSSDFRKTISTSGLAKLAATGQVAGPQSTAFLEDFLSKSPIARKAFEAQGFKDVFTDQGLDIGKFRKAAKEVVERVGGDPRLGAQTLGLTGDAAEGFVRLYESLDRVAEVQFKIENATGDLNRTYRESLGLGEAFKANINRVKSALSESFSEVTGGLTNLLGATAESDAGAAATTLGGGALAALLAGYGLRGIGGAVGGGVAGGVVKGAAATALTGKEVQPVYVVNAGEIGSGMGGALGGAAGSKIPGPGKAGEMGRKAGRAVGKFARGPGGKAVGALGAVGLGAGIGTAIGQAIEPTVTAFLDKHYSGQTKEGFEGNDLERLFFKLDKLLGGEASGKFIKSQKVLVEINERQLKKTKQPTRGSSF